MNFSFVFSSDYHELSYQESENERFCNKTKNKKFQPIFLIIKSWDIHININEKIIQSIDNADK